MGQGQSSTSGRDAAPPFEATPLDDPTANDGEQEWPLPSSHYDDDNEDSSFSPEPDVGHVGPMRRRPRLSPAASSSVGVGSSNNSSAAFQSPTLSRWNAHRDVPLQAMVNANETDARASHSWDQQRRTPPALVTPTATAALRAIHRVSNPPLYPDIPEVPEEASDFDESGSRVNVGGAGEELAGNESSSSAGNLPPPRPLPSPLAEALMMGLGRSGSTGHSSVRRASEPGLPQLGRSHQQPLDTIEVVSPPRPDMVARGASWTPGQVAPPTATLPLFADEGVDANLDPYEPTPQLMPSEDLPTPYGPQPSVYGTPAVGLDSDSPVQGTFPWLVRSPPPDQPQAPEASDELRQQATSMPPALSTHAPGHGLGLGSPLLLQPPPFTRAADPSPLSSSSAGGDSPESSDEAMSQTQRPTDGSLKRKAAPAYVSQLEGEPVALQSPSPPTPAQDASTDHHAQGAEMSRFSHSSASDAAARSEVNHLRAGPSVKRDSSLIQDLFRPSRLAAAQQQRGSSGAGRSRTGSFFSRFTGRARKGSLGATVAGLPPASSDADAASSLGEPPVFQIRPRQTSAPPEMGSLARRLEKAQRATLRSQEGASHKSPRLTATQHTVGGSVRRVPSFAGSHGSIRSGRSARSARGSATSLRQAYTQQEPAAAREGWEDIVEDEGMRRQEQEQEQSFKVKRKRVPLGVMFGWPRRGSGSSKQQQLHRNDVEALHDPRAQMQRAVSEPPPLSSNANPPPVVQKIVEEQHQQRPPGASAASLLTTPDYASSTSSFSSLAPPPAPQPVPPKRPRRPRRRTGSGSHSDSGRVREPQTAANAGDGEEVTTPIWDDSVQSIDVPAPHSPRGTLATIHSVPWRQDSDEGASRIEILHSERGSPLPSASNRASTSTSDLAPRAQSKLSQSYLEPESRPSSRATPGLTQKVSGQTFGVAGASEDHSRPSITQESTRASPPLQPPSAPFAATTRASPPTRASLGSLDSPRLPSHLRHAPEGSSSSFTKIAGDDEREENVALRSRVRVPSLAGSDVSKLSARGQLSSSAILAGEVGTPVASAAASSSSAAGTPRGMPFPLGGAGHRRVASGSAASGRLSTHLESPRQRVSSLGGAASRRPLPSLPTTARPPIDGLPATNDDATSLPLALRAGNHRESWNSADGPWAADIATASAARAPAVLASIPQGRATAIGRQRSRSSMHPRTEPLEADERSQAPAEASAGEAVRRMRSSSEPAQPRVPPPEGDNDNAGRWSPLDYDQVPKGGVQASLAALAALEKERRGEELNEPTTSRFLGSTLYALPPRASRRQADVSSSSSSLGPPKLSSKQLRERQEAAAAVAHLSGSRLRERAAPYERRRRSNAGGGYSSSRDGYSSTGTSTLASLQRRRKQRPERHAKDWTGMALASSDALEDHTSSDPMTTTADEMQRTAAYQALRRSLDTPRQRRDGRPPPSVAPGLRPSGADSHARHRSEFVMPGNAVPRVPTDRQYQELRREDGRGVWRDLAAGGWQHYVTPPRHLADQAAAALRAVASGARYEAEGTRGHDHPQQPSTSSPIIVIQSSRSPPGARERLPGNTQSGAAGSELIISSLQQQMRDLEKRLMDEMARSKAAAGAAAFGPATTSRPPLPPLPRAATTPAARRDTTTAVPHPTIPPLPTAPSPLLSDGLSPHLLQQHEDLARRVRDRETDAAGADMVPFPVTSSRPSSLLRARRQHERRGSRGGRYEEELAAAGIDELGRPIRSRLVDAPVSRSLPLHRGEGGEGNAYPSRHRDARAKTYGSGSRRDEYDNDGDPGPSRHRRGAPRRSRGQSERQWEGELEDDSAGKYYEERAHRPADAPRPSHRRRRSSSSSRARGTAAAAVAAKAQSKAKARVPSTSATSIGTGGSKAGYARGDILAWQKGLVVEEKDGDGEAGNGRRMGEGIV